MQYHKLSCDDCGALFYFPEIKGNTDTYIKCPECGSGVEIERTFKIKGFISFVWESGNTEDFVLGRSVRGISYDKRRPSSYMICLDRQNILGSDFILAITKLQEYIYHEVLPSLEKK